MRKNCLFGLHRWDGCVCSRCAKTRDRDHRWEGCRCSRCGRVRHVYETVAEVLEEGPGCCWDVSEPCMGPHCGVPCDCYFPGRAGKWHITLRCRFCGAQEGRTEIVEHLAPRT